MHGGAAWTAGKSSQRGKTETANSDKSIYQLKEKINYHGSWSYLLVVLSVMLLLNVVEGETNMIVNTIKYRSGPIYVKLNLVERMVDKFN